MTKETKVQEYRTRGFSKPSPLSQHHPTHHTYDYHARAHGKHISIDEKKITIQPSFPRTPRTPRREYSDSCPSESHSYENGSTRKIRYKNKPQNIMTSPAISQNIQSKSPRNSSQSTVLPSKSDRTPTNVAYAGPTFHASPAPSSLPIPSFYSKSMPESPALSNRVTSKDGQSTMSPNSLLSTTQSLSHSSPANVNSKVDQFSKEIISISPQSNSAASSRSSLNPINSRHSEHSLPNEDINSNIKNTSNSKPSASAMLSMELEEDLDSHTPYGAAFSTPYSERIKAIRPKSTSNLQPLAPNNPQRVDNAEALKAYLFLGHITTSNSPNDSEMVQSTPPLKPLALNEYLNSDCSQRANFPSLSRDNFNNKDPTNAGRKFPVPSSFSGSRQVFISSEAPSLENASENTTNNSLHEHNFVENGPVRHNTNLKDLIPGSSDHNAESPRISSARNIQSIQEMEDSLRKILKLDSLKSSNISKSNLKHRSVTTIPVPNIF